MAPFSMRNFESTLFFIVIRLILSDKKVLVQNELRRLTDFIQKGFLEKRVEH